MKHQDHYSSLDGLRGFAAISVVVYHLGHWLGVPFLAGNSYLAVDLFFCLSGFVLPLAYGRVKNPNLSATSFFRIRLIRLMPLIVIGTLISGAYVFFRLLVTHQHGEYHHLGMAVLLGLLSLPYLNAPGVIGGPQVFPLNGPQYTLFLELFINLLWFYGRSIFPLAGSLLVAIICFIGIAIIGGGGDTTATFWHGFTRVGASYFAGVALFEINQRFGASNILRKIFWPLCILMVFLFYYPKSIGLFGMLFWIAAVAPLLIFSGSKIVLSGRLKRLCLLGGELSYPIYVLQYPIFCWVNGIFQIVFHKKITWIEIPLIFCAILFLSFLALRICDEPARKMLSTLLRQRKIVSEVSSIGPRI